MQIKTNGCANQGRIMQKKQGVCVVKMPVFTQMREFEQAAHAPNQQRSSTGKKQTAKRSVKMHKSCSFSNVKFEVFIL
jgi:hypothetical protein